MSTAVHTRIAWFSPFPPQKSGVSDYSEQIVYELVKRCEVHLWAHGPVNEQIKEDFPVINYVDDSVTLGKLAGYDAVIYNMGNNTTYHENIYEVLIRHPGIVILHDYVLNGFFINYLSKMDYIKRLLSLYGLKGLVWYARNSLRYRLSQNLLKHVVGDRPFSFRDEMDFPFNEEVLAHARGIIVHSDYTRVRLIKKVPSVPVEKINHPYFSHPMETEHPPAEIFKPDKGKTLLLSIGEGMPYKQLDKVIRAIAMDGHLKERCLYYIIGRSYPNVMDLEKLIEENRLQSTVKLLGYQPIETVHEYLSQADVYIGLRYPTMGETSGGLIRAMERGRPCVVTDIGWYAELPDDCVVKIGAPVEVDELRGALRRLTDDKGYRESLSKNVKRHIHEEYSTERYVEKLLNFISREKLA